MKDTIDSRAVKIAARVMQAAGLCRYDSIAKCHRVYVEEITCERCIRSWLLSKSMAGHFTKATARTTRGTGPTESMTASTAQPATGRCRP